MGASCPWAIASTDYVVRVTSEEGKIGRGHLSRFQDPEEPIPVIVTPDGTLWVSTKEDGVSHFDGQTWTTYTEEDGLASNEVESVAVDPDNVLWAGTWGGGVSRFDGQTWTTYTQNDGLAKDYVRSVAVASDGALWFGTWDFGGTSRFDGQTWTSFLAGRDVLSIAAAPDGALWFGTTGEGVARYVPPD